jgi:hypothetical protein
METVGHSIRQHSPIKVTDTCCAPAPPSILSWAELLQLLSLHESESPHATVSSLPLPEVNVEALIRTSRENRDRVGLRSLFRPAFLRDRSVCFNYGIVESPTGNRAHTIEAGEDA